MELDSRIVERYRLLSCRASVLSRADGSAWVDSRKKPENVDEETNDDISSVLVAIYGPGQPANRFREFLDRSDPEVIILPPTHNAHYTYTDTNCNRGPYLQFLQQFILGAFKNQILLALHPRTQINIVIQILKDGGPSLLPTCINATTVALIDAGVPLATPLTAVHCTVMRDTTAQHAYTVTVEPSQAEARSEHCHALCYFALNRAGQVAAEWSTLSDSTHVTRQYSLPEHVLTAARRAAVSRGEELHQFVRRTVRDKTLYETRE